MNSEKKITIFDCTLREVGYQTGWFFDESFCRDVYLFAQGNNIDYIELGFFHNPEHDPGRGIFRYSSEKQDEIAHLFGHMKNRVKISAMRDIQRPLWPLKPRDNGAVDTVRILTRSHETDFKVLKKNVDEIRSLGYDIYINFTSAGYNTIERNGDFAQFAVDEGIPMIYFADTESVMTAGYVIDTIDICHKKGAKVGTHFHDKNGTAESLMKTALESDTDGLDFTLLGLGGKWLDGNLSIETYLHTFGHTGGYELTHLKNELIAQLIKFRQYSAAG
jgi:4-hydroxy 2-oxovalerate aldolase